MQVPLLLVGDCPSQNSGLARITRDLATVLSGQMEWRVATLGFWGSGSSRLPFHTFHMFQGEWGEQSLPLVWDEWSQGRQGVVMTIWDLSRLLWLARPEYASEGTREWLQQRRERTSQRNGGFSLWSYVPLDGMGTGNRLTSIARETLLGIDRIVVSSPWAEGIVRNTIGADEAGARGLTWLPHALGDVWQPRKGDPCGI